MDMIFYESKMANLLPHTLMCGTFGVNFGVNCDSTSPIRIRLLKIFRIFMIRTMVASIKWRRSSSIR